MTTKHTPGPWYIDNVQGDYLYIAARVAENEKKPWDNPTVCAFYEDVTPEDSVTFTNWYRGFDNAQANARLIASAPELLEALKKAESYIETPGDLSAEEIKYLLEDIRIAIAKAEGR